jgi:hypothetical protein
MSSVIGRLRGFAAYFFIVVGLVWAAVGALTGSALVAWPAGACFVGGAFIRFLPGRRLTWAWGLSTAAMGFIVSIYQIYAWSPLVGGAFSTLAGTALGGFAVFAVVHVLLFYAGASPGALRSETS